MKTIRWLGVVGVVVLALALIKIVFGESRLWIVAFTVVTFLVLEYARGSRKWFSAIVGALIAAAVYAIYVERLPADTAGKQAGFVLLTVAVAAPFVVRIVRDRQRQHQSG